MLVLITTSNLDGIPDFADSPYSDIHRLKDPPPLEVGVSWVRSRFRSRDCGFLFGLKVEYTG